jgi:hypothetical protein
MDSSFYTAFVRLPLRKLLIAWSIALAFSTSWAESVAGLPFSETIAAYHAQDEEAMPPRGAVLGVGSSSMRFWGPRMQDDMAPLTVIPRGFGGSQFFELNDAFEALVARYQPRAIMVYEGDNDLAVGKPIERVLLDFLVFVEKVRTLDPEIRIYVLAVKPSPARAELWPAAQTLNECFREICIRIKRLTYVDVATPLLKSDGGINHALFRSDRIHLNDAGYDIWSEAVREVLIPAESPFESEVEPAAGRTDS